MCYDITPLFDQASLYVHHHVLLVYRYNHILHDEVAPVVNWIEIVQGIADSAKGRSWKVVFPDADETNSKWSKESGPKVAQGQGVVVVHGMKNELCIKKVVVTSLALGSTFDFYNHAQVFAAF